MEWISVNDKLPDTGEPVLCFYDDVYHVASYHTTITSWAKRYENVWMVEVEEDVIIIPTHWQPLPKPPKL